MDKNRIEASSETVVSTAMVGNGPSDANVLRTAMQSLTRWAANLGDERRITSLQLTELVVLAEIFMSPAVRRHRNRERAKQWRVQAMCIAGLLGCLDPNPSRAPFRHYFLIKAYEDSQRFAGAR